MNQSFEVFCERFLELRKAQTPMVVVTLTGERGHAPQDIGARMIVGENEIFFGTVGGGKVEKMCIDLSREILARQSASVQETRTWNLQRDVGMTCGGELSFLFEAFHPGQDWKIALFGAGHIVQELAPLLLRLDCHLTVIDPRQEWLDRIPENPRLKKIETKEMVPCVEALAPDTFVAIITMGHTTDYPLVKEALQKMKFPYLGVIGSKVKRIKINSQLLEEGLAPERVKEFFCPMGEDYGKNAPAEIAISIASQMLQVRRDRMRANDSFLRQE